MQKNKLIRKMNGECKFGSIECHYLRSTLCCFFQVQLEKSNKSLFICNKIYGKMYSGKP